MLMSINGRRNVAVLHKNSSPIVILDPFTGPPRKIAVLQSKCEKRA